MLSNRGFTLVELLVVVSILAVLTAVIIPVIGSTMNKKTAAADAANLRNLAQQAATIYLSGQKTTDGMICFTPPETFQVVGGPTAKTGPFKGESATVALDSSKNQIVAKYYGHSYLYFAKIAETGKIPSESSSNEGTDK